MIIPILLAIGFIFEFAALMTSLAGMTFDLDPYGTAGFVWFSLMVAGATAFATALVVVILS